jgi:AraC-like DNA-binding protein
MLGANKHGADPSSYACEIRQELVIGSASRGLDRYIARYCGYEHEAAGPARQREALSTSVVLIFGMGPELGLVNRSDSAGAVRWFGSFVAGLDDACTVIEHNGVMRGVQVDLTPLAARMIFRTPMRALAREVVTLEDILGPEGRRLEERLRDAASWGARFMLIERALAARLAAAAPPPADVDWAWRRLLCTRGQIRVAELAAELGCSRKHLAARFAEHVGLPPKLFARMLRFRHASDRLAAREDTNLAELAAACGYYDQAHLDRDFREFADTTPTTYLSSQVTFIQDAARASS